MQSIKIKRRIKKAEREFQKVTCKNTLHRAVSIHRCIECGRVNISVESSSEGGGRDAGIIMRRSPTKYFRHASPSPDKHSEGRGLTSATRRKLHALPASFNVHVIGHSEVHRKNVSRLYTHEKKIKSTCMYKSAHLLMIFLQNAA